MTKTIEYNDIKGDLKELFDKFVANPTEFGVDAETAKEITNMNYLQSKGLWTLFKRQFKIKLSELNAEDLADVLQGDLEEDGVTIASKNSLERLLKHPEDPQYALEDDMIKQIQSMDDTEKEALRNQVSKKEHLNLAEKDDPSVGDKILGVLKILWTKMSPVLDKIFDIAVGIGAESLKNIVADRVKNDALSDVIGESIDTAAEAVQNLSEDVKTLGNNNDDPVES